MMHPLSLVTKRGSSFVYESSYHVRGRARIGYTRWRESVFEGCSEVLLYLFSLHVLVRDLDEKRPSKKRFKYLLGYLSFWVSGMESPLIFL